jgi:hypothetical protein
MTNGVPVTSTVLKNANFLVLKEPHRCNTPEVAKDWENFIADVKT